MSFFNETEVVSGHAPEPEHHRAVPEFHTFEDLRNLDPPEPLIQDILSQGSLAMLTGAPGSGKSFMALGWSLALASNVNGWEGHAVRKHGPVLYIIAEGREGFWERIPAWCVANGVDPETLRNNFVPWLFDPQLGDPYEVEFMLSRIKALNPVLTVFDTKSRVSETLDENSATEQFQAIKAVNRIREQTGGAQLLIHHTSGRNGVLSPRGSTAWDGALDIDMRMSKEDDLVMLKCHKRKDAEDGCVHYYESKLVEIPHHLRRKGQFFDGSHARVMVAAHPEMDQKTGGSVDRMMIKVFEDNDRGTGLSVSDLCSFMETRMGASKDLVFSSLNRLLKGAYLQTMEAGRGEKFERTTRDLPVSN